MAKYTGRAPLYIRFWRHVDIGGPTECWEWMAGRKAPGGYGQVWDNDTKQRRLAHRVAYELQHGITLPAGRGPTVIMHTCDNMGCVNPAHLKLSTQAENIASSFAKGRSTTRGTANGNAILTEEIVRLCRARMEAGERPADLAREFGVSGALMEFVRNRKRWAHVY